MKRATKLRAWACAFALICAYDLVSAKVAAATGDGWLAAGFVVLAIAWFLLARHLMRKSTEAEL
jgi:hypothetical protein